MQPYLFIASAAAAFILTVIIGPFLIRYLLKKKLGQKILEIGPKWHLKKQNTPTMGGVMFIISITAVVLVMNLVFTEFEAGNLMVLLMSLCYGAIGFVDDWAKIRHQANGGLTSGQKFLLQLAAAAVFVAALRLTGYLTPNLFLPFIGVTIPLPWIVFMLLAIFIIVGCDNAVNLTDGIDGLAASVTVPVAIFFIVIGYKTGNLPVVIYASALLGGLLGFLVFNFNPARVFMGDTGSLFLGGAVCGLALACDMPLILIFVGLIYIIETLSVIIQTTYFKMSGGKRIFKMAPIHHHFEMCGWGEKKIVFVFTAITAVMCVVAYFGAMPRF